MHSVNQGCGLDWFSDRVRVSSPSPAVGHRVRVRVRVRVSSPAVFFTGATHATYNQFTYEMMRASSLTHNTN